ncbi:MAG: ABC transporter permease [Lachnospiraceae bacterium]|nr:ABC transporter permease [Lachnospiraceae bacterium]
MKMFQKIFRTKTGRRKIGLILAAVLALIAVIGLFWTPYDPEAMSIVLKNGAPSFAHPFGTDNYGRDVLSRVMAGLSTTFLISASVVIIGAFLGTVIGLVTGYFGGLFDEIIMRVNDTLTAFPSILLALIFVSIMGSGKWNIILALGLLFIPSFARIMRGEVLKQKELEYVKNAKLMGAGFIRIIFVHILPNTKATLLPCILVGFNNAVLAEAGMSYLGLGVQPPEASLGRMIAEAQGYLLLAPWTALAPGIIVILMIFACSLAGEAD